MIMSRRRDMGDAGRRAVEAKYTWNVISKQMLDLYTHILADRGSSCVSDEPGKFAVS